MLHQELPAVAAQPLDGGDRWLLPALGGAALATGALLLWLVGSAVAGALVLVAAAGAAAAAWFLRRRSAAQPLQTVGGAPDYALVGRSGVPHAPTFQVEVRIKGVGEARGEGASKQEAETEAAKALLGKVK